MPMQRATRDRGTRLGEEPAPAHWELREREALAGLKAAGRRSLGIEPRCTGPWEAPPWRTPLITTELPGERRGATWQALLGTWPGGWGRIREERKLHPLSLVFPAHWLTSVPLLPAGIHPSAQRQGGAPPSSCLLTRQAPGTGMPGCLDGPVRPALATAPSPTPRQEHWGPS